MNDLRTIAVDWSGALVGAQKKIWLAEARGGRIVRLECGRGREALTQHLIDIARDAPRLVVGLDFAFSTPSWFLAEQRISSARELWRRCDEGAAEEWLAACAPPFWGRPGRPRTDGRDGRRTADAVVGAKSVFQIGGAGSVGTGSLRGMRSLHALAEAGFAIWPFDGPGWTMAIEIYPRLMTGPVVKSDPAKRAAYLAQRSPGEMDAATRARAVASEDAFDAAISALVMDAHRHELAHLPIVTDLQTRLEGAIWRPGWHE